MESFSFAGFTFPRHVPIYRGGRDVRKRWEFCYSAWPRPLTRGEPAEIGYYLDSDFAPGLRWQWAGEIDGIRSIPRGYYTDGGASETIGGIVLRLPHARGFLAGYSLGAGMSATVERTVYRDESDAAHAADSLAQYAAEREIAYQAASSAGREAAEAHAESMDARGEALELMRDLRRGRELLAWLSAPDLETAERLCLQLRNRAEALAETWRDARAKRDRLREEWSHSAGFADGYGEA